MKKTIILFIIIFETIDLLGQEIYIVRNKHPNATIVVLEKTNKQLNEVAINLREYIFKSTNAKLNITNSINPSQNNIIIATQFAGAVYNYNALDEDGFLIKTSKNNIIISGKTNWGTEYGVYEFLERFLGVRWLMPTELWTEIPVKSDIRVSKMEISENPKFLSRSFFPVNIENRNEQLNKWGRNNRLRNRVEFHHNLRNIFKVENIVKSNPQFLPVIDGKRYIPKNNRDENWQPNFRANGVDSYAANEIIKYFRDNPERMSISLGVNDSGNFDKRNSSEKINYIGRENYSDAYYNWVNKTVSIVNRNVQGKKFGLLAYSRVAEPPNFRLVDNVIPFITYERLMWLEPALKRKDIEVSRTWQQLTKEYGWYDYVYGGVYLVPRIYFNHYQEYLKTAYSLNVRYYVAEYYPNWLEGPKGWLMTKLLWNPNQNLDILLNDWYVNAVGQKSADYLKQFYDLWENVWTKDIPKSNWWKRKGGTYLYFDVQTYVSDIAYDKILRADELLKMAYNNTSNNIQRARVNDLMDMWEFSKMNYLYFRQKNNNSTKSVNQEQRLINAKKVTKKEIDVKIEELEKHPLHNTIMYMYKSPNRVRY